MKTWIVARPEVYISYHRVEAVTEQDDYDAPETGKILERAKFVETRPIRPGVFPKWTEV